MRHLLRRYPQRAPKKYYQLNQRIEANILRVIDGAGKQLGILSKSEAIELANKNSLDLVLIAPKANPPVAKITDFKKFLYQEEKREKEAKKGIKKSIVKDLKLSLFIGQADLDRLVGKAKKFLADGNQIRFNLTLKGREIGKQDRGIKLMQKIINELGDVNVSKAPRLDGRIIQAVVAKKK